MDMRWSGERGDAGKTGFLESNIAPPLTLRWKKNVSKGQYGVVGGGVAAICCVGEIVGLDNQKGTELWCLQGKRKQFECSHLTLDQGIICFSDGRNLYGVWHDTGELIWKKRVPEQIEALTTESIALGGYLGIGAFGIEVESGKILRELSSSGESAFHRVLVGSNYLWADEPHNDMLIKCDRKAGETLLSVKADKYNLICASDRYVLGVCGSSRSSTGMNMLRSWDAHTGQVLKEWHAFPGRTICLNGNKAFALNYSLRNSADESNALTGWDVEAGKLLWCCTEEYNSPATKRCDSKGLIATENFLWYTYVEVNKTGNRKSFLVAVCADSGEIQWRESFSGRCQQLMANDENLFLIADNTVYCYGYNEHSNGMASNSKSEKVESIEKIAGENNRRKQRFKKRKSVRLKKNGEYPLSNGKFLILDQPAQAQLLYLKTESGEKKKLIDFGNERPVDVFDVHADQDVAVFAPSFSPEDGHPRLVLFQNDKTIKIDVDDGPANCTAMVIDPDGIRVACTYTGIEEAEGGHLRLFEIQSGKQLAEWPLHEDHALASDLKWEAEDLVSYCDVGSPVDGEDRRYKLDVSSGSIT